MIPSAVHEKKHEELIRRVASNIFVNIHLLIRLSEVDVHKHVMACIDHRMFGMHLFWMVFF